MKTITKKIITLFLFVAFCFTNTYATNVVINEINYRSVELQKDIDFIELYNASSVSVNLTDWQLT